MLHLLRVLINDIKAFLRGERRVVPRHITRGRIYQKKGSTQAEPSNIITTRKEPKATLTMKVTRADGSVEIIKVPASVTLTDNSNGKHFHTSR